jgi:hypothetical protein
LRIARFAKDRVVAIKAGARTEELPDEIYAEDEVPAEDEVYAEDEIPAEGTPERTRLAASAMQRRQRQVFGGTIQWEAGFFGWLAAIGLAALLIAALIGAGVAVGLTELDDGANRQVEELSVGGGALLIAILALAYCAGGYVAARMARFDGWRQGLGVWLLSLLMTLALAVTAWIAGGEVNPLESLDLPRIPIDEGPLTAGGAVASAIIVVVSLGAAIAGGLLGERFHRAVDAAAIDFGAAAETPAGDEARDERAETA